MTVHIPHTLEEATSLLSADTGAQLLAGGTDFMVEVNFGHRKPGNVVSLSNIPELAHWHDNGESVTIGSGVTWAEIEKGELARIFPAFAEAARTVGSPQIRAAGTVGGNIGTCSPAGDGLPFLAATDSVVHLSSVRGTREVPFRQFMTGPKRNSRERDEIITAVTIPKTDGAQAYAKVGVRNAMVISIASACLVIDRGRVRVALGSVGPVIIRATEAEKWLDDLNAVPGRAVTTAVAREFGERVAREASPIDDHRSTAAYRRHAVSVLSRRLLERGTSS